jgi:hypothetical protein
LCLAGLYFWGEYALVLGLVVYRLIGCQNDGGVVDDVMIHAFGGTGCADVFEPETTIFWRAVLTARVSLWVFAGLGHVRRKPLRNVSRGLVWSLNGVVGYEPRGHARGGG